MDNDYADCNDTDIENDFDIGDNTDIYIDICADIENRSENLLQ